ncbi:MAG TPA: hypothetical protein VF062_10530 [Candidatus Limnocylindrales bacterium]
MVALFTAGLPIPASALLAFEATSRLGAVRLTLGWDGLPTGEQRPPYRVVEIYRAVCATLSGKQTLHVTKQTETGAVNGGTTINGIAPVAGQTCRQHSGEEGKWESVELISAIAYPLQAG